MFKSHVNLSLNQAYTSYKSYRLLHTTADDGQEVLYASTTMKGKGPKLPERRKGATTNAQAGSPGFVEQVGHLPFVEAPALVARLIDDCVRSAG